MKRSMLRRSVLSLCALGVFAGIAVAEQPRKAPAEDRGMLSRETKTEDRDLTARINSSADVIRELSTKHPEIARNLTAKSGCVAVIPGIIKAAAVVGGEYGRGVVSCKDANGKFSAPSFVKIYGGSVGLQLGAQSTDLLMYVVGKNVRQTVEKQEYTLGTDLAVAAGTLDKNAQYSLEQGVYTFVKSSGLFAGASVDGAKIVADDSANSAFYGRAITPTEILSGGVPAKTPAAAKKLTDSLENTL